MTTIVFGSSTVTIPTISIPVQPPSVSHVSLPGTLSHETSTSVDTTTSGTGSLTGTPTSPTLSATSVMPTSSASAASSSGSVAAVGATSSSKPSSGAIAGAVVGSVAVLLALIAVYLFFRVCYPRRVNKEHAGILGFAPGKGSPTSPAIGSPKSARRPRTPAAVARASHAGWAGLGSVDSTKSGERGHARAAERKQSAVSVTSDDDLRTMEGGEPMDKLAGVSMSSTASSPLSDVAPLEYGGFGRSMDDEAVGRERAARKAKRASSSSSVTMVVGNHRYSDGTPAPSHGPRKPPPPITPSASNRRASSGSSKYERESGPASPTYPPPLPMGAMPPNFVMPFATPSKTQPERGGRGSEGSVEDGVRRATSAGANANGNARRTPRKPVPRYDSNELREVPAAHVRPELVRKASADQLAALGGGPVHYLIPDMPPPQRE